MGALDKFKLDVDNISKDQIMILKKFKREADKHLHYFYSTMGAFKNPELRVKCFDTLEFEQLLPEVSSIINQFENKTKDGRRTRQNY